MIPLPTGAEVLAFLGWPSDSTLQQQADQHAEQVGVMVRTYVRGRGFSEDRTQAEEDLAAVIVSSAARSLNNPAQDRRIEAGSFNSAPGSFHGWSLAELAILHSHRRRAGGV